MKGDDSFLPCVDRLLDAIGVEVAVKFGVGDRVVHPVFGVGVVKSQSNQQFAAGHCRQYYEVDLAGSTVWVPVNDSDTTVLRAIAPKQTVDECRQLLSDEPALFSRKHSVRQNEIAYRMKGGLLPAVCRTVRDLRARSWTIPLTGGEDLLLRKLSKWLCDEWAASAGVSATHALREIEEYLKKGRLVYAPESVKTQSNRCLRREWS